MIGVTTNPLPILRAVRKAAPNGARLLLCELVLTGAFGFACTL